MKKYIKPQQTIDIALKRIDSLKKNKTITLSDTEKKMSKQELIVYLEDTLKKYKQLISEPISTDKTLDIVMRLEDNLTNYAFVKNYQQNISR